MASVSYIRKTCQGKRAEEFAALKAYRAAGGKVLGYTCQAFPAAVAAGLGLRPVRLLCGISADAERSGEKIVRPDVCPHVKSLLGNIAEGRGLHGKVDIWAGLYTCDQMRRGMNCISNDLGREVHPLQLPATRTDQTAGYYAFQVSRLVSDIGRLHGISFDPGLASMWQKEYETAAEVLARAALSCEVSPLDLHAMFHLFFVARPYGLATFFEELISSSEKFSGQKTVVLSGSPVAFEDTVLMEELEERRIAVVPLNCTGLNAVEFGGHIEIDNATPEYLAQKAFVLSPCARTRPNTVVYERIATTLKTVDASGLIVKCLKFCDQWYTERERMRRTFDMPVLVFDSDYAEGGRERLKSRIEAFLEMLD